MELGLGIAEAFAKNGDHIIFNGLEENGSEIAENIGKKYGMKTAFRNSNLMTAEGGQDLIDFAYREFGRIDIWVNNAGIQYVSPVEDFPLEKYEQIIALNINSVFYASRAVFRQMKEQRFGRIINISSVHGLRASEFKSAYVTAKHGVVGLTKVLALEGAPYNVTCNAVCPGYVKTPLVEGQIKDQAKADGMSENEAVEKVMLKKQAVKSFVPVEKLGEIVVFLSAENATSVTGTTFTLDGAWTAQ
ncbi:3-hydroxybutyrate dehydrogenase [Chryseobacterium suipulveris]|uniref:3-hydroxybutyrate dehydrogenase n=1 Tax=Chryseobacterium suipulveris TaxID=2929800 RepID=A0ABY4C015_9FLAO|nr:3-hydroxybutyrate dehydrogenase [Chryseobacterium suipulveris]UOE42100.1 3-hydroxybutyrate dehydrogenase [Chryseobacterium suipulveris]